MEVPRKEKVKQDPISAQFYGVVAEISNFSMVNKF